MYILMALLFFSFSCASDKEAVVSNTNNPVATLNNHAEIIAVSVTGGNGNYNFSVSVNSPDTGCNQYADWWEIISEEGHLISRRILLHSHVNEQPFSRSQNGVLVSQNRVLIIRAHMNTTGYGNQAFIGSIATGFESILLTNDFASDLAIKNPLPSNCAF